MRIFDGKLFFVLIAFVMLIFVSIIVLTYNNCKSRGGTMEPNGVYNTTYIYSGNVMVPIVSEGSECSK